MMCELYTASYYSSGRLLRMTKRFLALQNLPPRKLHVSGTKESVPACHSSLLKPGNAGLTKIAGNCWLVI